MGNSLQAYLCLDISDIFRNVSKYIVRTPNVSLNRTVVYAEIFWKKMLSKSYQSNSVYCKFCNDGDSQRSNALFKALVQNTLTGKNREIQRHSNVHLKDAWRFQAY